MYVITISDFVISSAHDPAQLVMILCSTGASCLLYCDDVPLSLTTKCTDITSAGEASLDSEAIVEYTHQTHAIAIGLLGMRQRSQKDFPQPISPTARHIRDRNRLVATLTKQTHFT